MRVSKRRRPWLRQLAAVGRQLAWLTRLPPRVCVLYLRFLTRAVRTSDQWTIDVSTRPRELSLLLERARGARVVVETGTASGWTAAALAVAERGRQVITLDPQAHDARERYLSLLDRETRSRIRLVRAAGEEGAAVLEGHHPPVVDALFVDGDHSRQATIADFRAWQPALAPGALVAFHDYGDPDYPGVAEAVGELGLRGELRGTLLVCTY